MSSKMTDTPETLSSPALLAQIDACLALSGSDGWALAFIDLVAATGAAQVMIFSYAADHANCLLSRNFRAKALGTRLARDYLEGWYRQDPLYPRVMAAEPGKTGIVSQGASSEAMSADYRARFFGDPGLGGKTAVIVAGQRLRLIVNLYWAERDEDATLPEPLLSLLARLALLHFETPAENALPAPLAVLSERERAVCLGILSGRKAEQIAADLDIAPSSVVTYRARAYAKLGISSRGALFAICGAGS